MQPTGFEGGAGTAVFKGNKSSHVAVGRPRLRRQAIERKSRAGIELRQAGSRRKAEAKEKESAESFHRACRFRG